MTGRRDLALVTAGRHHHFADVNGPLRIDTDAMAREESAGRARVVAPSPARQQMAGSVEDADVRSACRLRWVGLKWKPAGLESHVAHEGPIVGIKPDLHRTPGVRPLLQILAVRRESLNPAVLAL